jgi:hypothetical protein
MSKVESSSRVGSAEQPMTRRWAAHGGSFRASLDGLTEVEVGESVS